MGMRRRGRSSRRLCQIAWLPLVLSLMSLCPSALSVCPSGCACDDENLHVNCDDANLDFVPITLNPLIQKLLLKNNGIRSVETGFSFYHELTFIDLSHNHLLKISQGSFSTQSKLNELHLNNNKITSLSSQAFGSGITGMTGANVHRGLPSLIHLNLRVNFLETIEPGFFIHTKNLQELDLGENRLRNINSSAFTGLEKLRILRLDRNELRHMPHVFSNGSYNFEQLPAYPLASVPLAQLIELFMGMNPLGRLENNAFTALSNLALLDLRGCSLSYIASEAFYGLSHLKKLILSDNNLRVVPSPAFSHIQQLEIVKIGRNPITSLGANTFSPLRILKVMEMNGAPELKTVDVDTFVDNLDLEVIDISNAKRLNALPPKLFSGMSSLKHLILKDNALSTLPEDLASWQSLRILRLEGNPFRCSCDLLWLRDVLALPMFKNSSFLVLCDLPQDVSEKRINSLSEKDLNCHNAHVQKTLLGVCIGVVVVLLALFFFLLYRFHDRIKNTCKRNCFHRGRNSGGLRKSQRGNTVSAVKGSELENSTKTSFLSQSAYPYSDEEYVLRTSLMSTSPNGTHSLNPKHLNHPQFQLSNYALHSLSHPYVHQSHGPPFVHGHPNGTHSVPQYAHAEYETPVNLGIDGLYNSHHYAAPMLGNAHFHQPNVHYNSHEQALKPIPITEL